MSGFGSNNGGSPPPSRAPSPTPSQKQREADKDAEAAIQKDIDFKKARDRGWVEGTDVDIHTKTADGEWLGSGGKYEWVDDFGDVAPDIPELEQILFGSEIPQPGEYMDAITMAVQVEGPHPIAPIRSFDDAGLHPVILENVKRCGYEVPTAVQSYTIPAVKLNYDVVAIALTGSGKTAGYLIPVLSKLMGKAKKLRGPRPNVDHTLSSYDHRRNGVRAEPLVLIVVPTRELAVQIFDETRRMCYKSMLRPCAAYGGYPMGEQVRDLSKGCDILIATPGRLCALMDKPDLITMSRVKYTIIDEADEMLQQDWSEELTKILQGGDSNEDADHLYLLFSATFPSTARALARELMAPDYFRIRVGRPGQAHQNIKQEIISVEPDRKRDACYDYILSIDKPARTLIFCSSKAAVDSLDDFLFNRGLPTTSIHADRDQTHREDSIRAFRTGRCPIMIATNIACRGWDVKDVQFVINYDLPKQDYGGIAEYVHRIGRTGRIGYKGTAISFYTDRDEDMAQQLVNILAECDQEIPEFLSHLKPEEGEDINHDDDSVVGDDAAEGDGFGEEADAEAEGGAEVPAAAPADW